MYNTKNLLIEIQRPVIQKDLKIKTALDIFEIFPFSFNKKSAKLHKRINYDI